MTEATHVQNTPPPAKPLMTAEEIAAVAKTLELIRKCPPKAEGWNHGEQTLEEMLRAWLKEQL